ncbi:MAG: peptidase A24 [Anaerolineaceae bacterium]|jgi:preflagellin peptidase FlaK|nr:peptidase A24 [Anaerolineaceae bacterium]
MELMYPMIISAVAVLATLVYASYLDVKDRRVPFKTWYPMLIVGIPATALLLYQLSMNLGLTFCYTTIAATLLYDGYIDNETRSKRFDYLFLGIILILPALSWFVFSQKTPILIIQSYVLYVALFLFIYYYDNIRIKTEKEKKKIANTKKTGTNVQRTLIQFLREYYYFFILFIVIVVSFHFGIRGDWGDYFYVIPLIAIFCAAFYFIGLRNFFGGADAWALIFITVCIPLFPVEPFFGYNPIQFLPFTVLINALLINLIAPLGIFLVNAAKRNWAPFPIMFLGFPVKGEKIQNSWGFVMEVIGEDNGIIKRKFAGFWNMLWDLLKNKKRGVYTKDLREYPEEFSAELAMYKKAGTVWISYAVPFIIPITAGLITAVVFGDFLLACMKLFVSGA